MESTAATNLFDCDSNEDVPVDRLPARSGMAAGLAAWLGLASKLRRWLPVNPDQCCSQEITLRVHRGRGDVESPRDRPAITLVERPHNQTRYEHRAT